MRIVGGDARGRVLRSVEGDATRPTADRVRQSLFDRLGQRCDGLAVLDLFAGTGALAFESLSRGASRAVLVEQAKDALAVIEHNAAVLGYTDRCSFVRDDVLRAIGTLARRGESFALVFSDPPYALRNSAEVLARLADASLLAPEGRVVLERDKREPVPSAPAGFVLVDDRDYGGTSLAIFQRERAAPTQPS